MIPLRVRHLVVAGVAVVVLAAGSTVGLAAAGGAFRHSWSAPNGACSAPSPPGSIVDVSLVDMGPMMGSMMGGWSGPMRGLTSKSSVSAGTVSLRVVNTGSRVHELVVLPLAPGRQVGERAVGPDERVSEVGSLGEASRSCGPGAGDGIAPGSVGWVTLTLGPGRYELICNEPDHYSAGMRAELDVA